MSTQQDHAEYIQSSLQELLAESPAPVEIKADADFFTDADLIYRYTRAQALEDGVLVDVSATAHEAGFTCPVAVTATVWAMVESIPPKFQGCQSISGRLWDLVYMAVMEIRRHRRESGTELLYRFIMHHGRQTYVTLKIVFGSGDDGELVVTIMLPDED